MFTHVVGSFTILLGGLFLTQGAVFIGSVMLSSIVLFLQYHGLIIFYRSVIFPLNVGRVKIFPKMLLFRLFIVYNYCFRFCISIVFTDDRVPVMKPPFVWCETGIREVAGGGGRTGWNLKTTPHSTLSLSDRRRYRPARIVTYILGRRFRRRPFPAKFPLVAGKPSTF